MYYLIVAKYIATLLLKSDLFGNAVLTLDAHSAQGPPGKNRGPSISSEATCRVTCVTHTISHGQDDRPVDHVVTVITESHTQQSELHAQ